MKALLLTAPSRLEYTEVPEPTPAPGEVLLRIRACGICGSDIHGWDGSSGRRRPPLIMGHEAAGEIAGLGAGVIGWQVGDRVTFDSTIYCGECTYCREGQVNLCEHRRVVGAAPAEFHQDGAFAEYLALPARGLVRLPEALSFPHAAMIEPVAIAVHAVRRTKLRPADTAVVIGAGLIGLLVIQALRWTGVRRIVAIDLSDHRLALARTFGATDVFRSDQGDATAAVTKLTDGRGADVAFEVVGIAATLNLALQLLRRGGAAVLVGNLSPTTAGFPLQAVVTRELTVTGSCSSAGEYPLCLDLIARGEIRVEPMISSVAPLRDGPEWFSRLSSRDGANHLKVILEP